MIALQVAIILPSLVTIALFKDTILLQQLPCFRDPACEDCRGTLLSIRHTLSAILGEYAGVMAESSMLRSRSYTSLSHRIRVMVCSRTSFTVRLM